jgi:hypothetical protein
VNLATDLSGVDFSSLELRVIAAARIVRHRDGLFSATPLGQGLPPYYLVVMPGCAPIRVDVYAKPEPLGSSEMAVPWLSWSELADSALERGAWVEFNPTSVEEWNRIYDGAGGIRQSAGPAFKLDSQLLDELLSGAVSHHQV